MPQNAKLYVAYVGSAFAVGYYLVRAASVDAIVPQIVSHAMAYEDDAVIRATEIAADTLVPIDRGVRETYERHQPAADALADVDAVMITLPHWAPEYPAFVAQYGPQDEAY